MSHGVLECVLCLSLNVCLIGKLSDALILSFQCSPGNVLQLTMGKVANQRITVMEIMALNTSL